MWNSLLFASVEFEMEGGCCLTGAKDDRSRCFNVFRPTCVRPLPRREVRRPQ